MPKRPTRFEILIPQLMKEAEAEDASEPPLSHQPVWSVPMDDHFEALTVETDQPGLLVNITNTRQVAEILTGQWPADRKGEAYRRAVVACMEHLRGMQNTEAVRAAFIGAAKEAGIFVREYRIFQ